MFTDIINKEPTYSLQFGQVIADEVTSQLFGHNVRSTHCSMRNCTDISILYHDTMSKHMKDCHTLWAKTCGDGVTIEAVKIYSFITDRRINTISNDLCCNYRSVAANGVSCRQAPSKPIDTVHRTIELFTT